APNQSTSPTLDVTVTDPEGDPMTVTFYGRDAAATGPDFTVIALPDTQFYVSSPSVNGGSPATFDAQTQWIVANKTALNIADVAQLGDCVNTAATNQEWVNADHSIDFLENPTTTGL